MRNNKIFYGLALLFFAGVVFYIGMSVSKKTFFDDKENRGEHILQDSVSITGVTNVLSSCNCNVEIIPSDKDQVVFFYNKKYYENKSSMNGANLEININTIKKGFFNWNTNLEGVDVKVYSTSLKQIAQEGIGSIECNAMYETDDLKLINDGVGSMSFNVNVNNLIIENSGVGSIDIIGKSNHAIIDNSGTGSISGATLINKFAKVENAGVGSVEVNATDSLDMSNTGVGGITYSGNAVITNINSEGVGSINKQ